MHIQPEAYFSGKTPTAVSTDFIEDIVTKLGRELTPDEKIALNYTDSIASDEDIDVIERA